MRDCATYDVDRTRFAGILIGCKEKGRCHVSPLFIITLVIWAASSIGLIILVLLHSGKGAGLSETFGGSMGNDFGTGIIEKNLNRITIVVALVFVATLIAMMFVWPTSGV